jgi:hypothetical protein
MLNLGKMRPFFGSSVTQNTKQDHDHKLELYTGVNVKTIKKSAIKNESIPSPNLKYNRDFSREISPEASKWRNNELPFKQIRVNKMVDNDKHLTGDYRYAMTPDVSRQNLKGMVPTGYSDVRKPVTLDTIFDPKKRDKEVTESLPGKLSFARFKPVKISDYFRKTDKLEYENDFDRNLKIANSNKKQRNPELYKETDTTMTRVNNVNKRSNIVNKLGITDHDYIRTSDKDKARMNTEVSTNLSYPMKLSGVPATENIVKVDRTTAPMKAYKFLHYEPYAGREMSFKTKQSVISDYSTPGDRSFKWNNISPEVTVSGKSQRGILLPRNHELNKPDMNQINTLSGNKKVYDMSDRLNRVIPKRIVNMENINKTT